MIISASRRTDIPAFYSDWFLGRVKEGFVSTRNPRNHQQVRKITLAPDEVDGIVFWTKNPTPMLARLGELRGFMYYFQFSLTPYGRDIEPHLPPKNDTLIPAFKELSAKIGAARVIWRYDPILLNGKYTADYHLRAFGKIAQALRGFTQKVIISFIDTSYRGVRGNIGELALTDFPDDKKIMLAAQFAQTAHSHGMEMEACAQSLDLARYGIGKARCVDGGLLSKLSGRELNAKKDKNQRPECGCAAGVDIGVYNTCKNGCRYCYANYNPGAISGNAGKHNPLSAFLIEHHNNN